MSFETQAKISGREPFTVVELLLDRCSLRYGESPCQASLGVTGNTQCFNTRSTCQDTANYTPVEHTLRFCSSRSPRPKLLVNAFPQIMDVDMTPGRLDPAGGLGQRATASVTFQDHPYHDRGLDPYYRVRYGSSIAEDLQAESGGEALQAESGGEELLATDAELNASNRIAGTFWGRTLARNPYYQQRKCVVRTGYIVDGEYDPTQFIDRTYLLESIVGPDASGRVQLKAKDPLKMLDDERSQAPFPSNGRLVSAVDESETTLNVDAGAIDLDDEYPVSGPFYIRIGSEVLEVTSRFVNFFTVQRAQFGTQASTHDVDDTVQLCLRYAAQRAHVIYEDLLSTYALMDATFIPYADWTTEADAYLPRTYSTLITEPTPVKDLVKELCKSGLFSTWYDERVAQIKMRAIREPDPDALTLNENEHIIADSVQVTFKPELRISQSWVYFAQTDPTESLEEVRNYRQLSVAADLESEGDNKFRAPAIDKIFSRWITSRTNADEVALRMTQLFGETPRQIKFSLDAKDGANIWLGDLLSIKTRQVQNALGRKQTLTIQIIEADEVESAHLYVYTGQSYNFAAPIDTGLVISIAIDRNDVNLYDLFIEDQGSAPTGATEVTFVVEAGVIVGQDVNAQAMTTGTWPTGAVIQLENNGRIQGRGGDGATFDGVDSVTSGTDGGLAFKAEAPITVTNASEIWGGGGGGMGEVNSPGFGQEMNPGGGGAGTVVGAGGERATKLMSGDWTGTGEFSADGTSSTGGAATGVGEEAAGGDGGDPGDDGSDGPDGVGGDDMDFGLAGAAVNGDSLITWITLGDRRGAIS
jgi:hypothetical protein